MKKKLKRALALLLAAALLAPMLPCVASAGTRVPVINVSGEKKILVYREDGTSYAPTEEKADAILDEAIEELAPVFVKAFLTNNYGEWSEMALEKLTPIYDEIRPAPDGTLPENTGPDLEEAASFMRGELPEPEAVNYYYNYAWDYRRSPLDAADDLQAYIEAVEAKTGSEKVVLVTRCGSTSLGAAYLYKYGTDDLAKIIFASSTLECAPHVDAVLSGNVTIPASAFYYFVAKDGTLDGVDGRLVRFIKAMLFAVTENQSADDLIPVIMTVYEKIKDCFIAPFLRSYYGICGNYVALVGPHYEDYRASVFPTPELEAEYAPILEKADEYRNNVQSCLAELLSAARDGGVPVYFLAFYGEPNGYPVSETSVLVGDELADAGLQSLGATVAVYPGALSADYLAAREAAGFGAYLSPDGQIDASTCLFPETTWFIKNMRHVFFGNDLHNFIRLIAWTEGMTVDSDPAYPRFLTVVGNHAGLAPAQAVNENDIDPASFEPEQDDGVKAVSDVFAFFMKILGFFARVVRWVKTRLGVRPFGTGGGNAAPHEQIFYGSPFRPVLRRAGRFFLFGRRLPTDSAPGRAYNRATNSRV